MKFPIRSLGTFGLLLAGPVLLTPLFVCADSGAPLRPMDVLTRERARLDKDFARLESFVAALGEMEREMEGYCADFDAAKRGHFSAEEHEAIEQLLFRYLACREAIWEIIEYYWDYEENFSSEENRAHAILTGYCSALHLYYYSGRLVLTFWDDELVRAKLNEAYYRSEIPAGSYDRLFESVTDPDHLRRLDAAWEIFMEEVRDKDSWLQRLRHEDKKLDDIANVILKTRRDTVKMRDEILDKSSLIFPSLRNAIRHQSVMKLAKEGMEGASNKLYALRGVTFLNVSRLRNPRSTTLNLTGDQIAWVKQKLQPGDVILTFSQGYMSNLFLPGSFKHGLTYVGSPTDRRAAGLREDDDVRQPGGQRQFVNHLNQSMTEDGAPADVIEAVGEGVVFSSLRDLTRGRVSRLVALRPRVTVDERSKQLHELFRFLGAGYDFKFDFSNASYLCCTELIYRTLIGARGVNFRLTRQMGRMVLSAEDICRGAIAETGRGFDVVLLVTREVGSKSTTMLQGDKAADGLKTILENAGS